MSKNKYHYDIELIKKKDVLKELISLNGKTQLFAVLLDANERLIDLERTSINSIKVMLASDHCAFIKKMEK